MWTNRRDFLKTLGLAGGTLSTAQMTGLLARAAQVGDAQVLAPRPAHFNPQAKRLLFVYLTGGFSHLDTFDPKPRLRELHGKPIPAFGLRPDETKSQPLLGSPFEFRQCGQSGLWMSELFPKLREVADDLCVLRTLHTDIVEHFQATLAMHTGSSTIPLPSLGAWLSYALGTYNPNLPSYLVLAEHLPYAGAQVMDSNFLPPHHQGVRIIPGKDPIPNLRPAPQDVTLKQLESQMLESVNRTHAQRHPNNRQLNARIQSFETARGMMREAPEVFDLSNERVKTLEFYGVRPGDTTSFAWQCLMARRFLERGVRVMELIDTGSQDNWDAHGDMEAHRPKALRVDQALSALLQDLKSRGLFEDTLIVIATEFGRTPWTDSSNGKGRNHFAKAFTCLLAGAGVKGGTAVGETDEFGASILHTPVHVHDYHATILHLMGLDHTRLTYRYAGRDYRLTDVSGEVVRQALV